MLFTVMKHLAEEAEGSADEDEAEGASEGDGEVNENFIGSTS